MNSTQIVRMTERFERLSELANSVKWHKTEFNTGYYSPGMEIIYTHIPDKGQSISWSIQASHALEGAFNEQSNVRKTWDRVIASNEGNNIPDVFGQLKALFEGAVELVRNGSLVTLAEAIQAETLGELLDQAEDLLGLGCLQAAAGIAGGALETHLRHLVDRHKLVVEGHGSMEKYNTLIGQERKAGNEIYSLGDSKQVTSWGDTRNLADHKPLEFKKSKEEVSLMIQGIRNFLSRVP
jgi:hypothetical protein